MQLLVEYNDKKYLIPAPTGTFSLNAFFHQVNEGRWPDECHTKEMIERDVRFLCKLNDEARLEE